MLRTLPLLLAVLAVALFVAAPVLAADETQEGLVKKAEGSNRGAQPKRSAGRRLTGSGAPFFARRRAPN